MDKNKNLPVFELLIDPKKGFEVDRISIVDYPAVESNFLAFSADKPKQIFNVDSEEYMEIIGVAMTPDKLIPRIDLKTKTEYNVWFSKNTVRSIAQQYFFNGYQHSINLQHTETLVDAHVYQSYIVDNAKGIYAPKGIDANDGSWIVGLKINASSNGNRVWKAIKEEKLFQGFSVEGYFIDQLTRNFNMEKFKVDDMYLNALKELEAELDEFIKANRL